VANFRLAVTARIREKAEALRTKYGL